MIRQLSRSIREYKMYAILALMMVGEVAMEVLIPTSWRDLWTAA